TGFVGGSYNEYGGYYALRQGDAHSWVEAYTGERWVTFDPTPPSRDALQPAEGWLARARAFFDALRTHWSRDVVGYDLRAQANALRRAFDWLASFRRPDRDAEATAAAGERGEREVPIWPWLVGAVLLALVLAWRLVRRARAPRGSGPAPAVEAVRVYREL